MEFRQQTLPNGLEVIAECNEHAYSCGYAFFVNTGSRDETDALSGVSHFLEHMTFKGTPTRTAEQVNRELDEIGSQSNAYTSEENTVYYATVLPEYQQRTVELLSDIMRPSLRDDDFDVEKKVIIEEIRKYDDQPPYGAYEKCMAAYFGDHTLGRSILGTVESVTALTPDSMRGYFERRYSPGNLTLVAAGKVDFDGLVAEVERRCGDWVPSESGRDTPVVKPASEFIALQKESAVQQYAVQIVGAPSAEDEQRYASRLLTTILGDDSGSRLYWDLIETGLAEYASMSNYEFQGAGIVMTYVCGSPDDAQSNLDRVRDVLTKATSDGVTAEELEQAKNKIASHIVLRSERPGNRMFALGNHWLQRNQHQSVAQAVEAYQQVTLDEVNAVLKAYALTDPTTVTIGPLDV